MKIIDIRIREELKKPVFASKGSRYSRHVWLFRLGACFSIFALFFGIGATISYFTDVEIYVNNVLAATILDFDLAGTPWLPASDAVDLDPGDEVTRNVDVVDDDSTTFTYKVKPEMTGGDASFCGALNVRANLEGSEVYSGNLLAFESAPVGFGPAGDNWTFAVSVPSAFGSSTCLFDFVYQAWQSTPFIFPGGFSDVERIGNIISSGQECGEFEIKSRGYWKNHEEDWILPQTVGVISIATPAEADDMLNANDNMTDKLGREVLALKFNVAKFGVGDSLVPGEDIKISELIAEADALLTADFPDPDPIEDGELEDMKDRVEKTNNAKKVSPCKDPPKDECDKDDDDGDHDENDEYDDNRNHRLRVTRVEAGGTVMIMTRDGGGHGDHGDDDCDDDDNVPTPTPTPTLTPTPTPENSNANIIATKIICDSESDLPNWGLGGPFITENTVSDFLSAHDSCHLASGWNFQWAPENSASIDPGGSFIGEAGSPWTTFGETDTSGVAMTTIDTLNVGAFVWVREVLKDGYIPFTFDQGNQSNDNSVSAEVYCYNDVENFDNIDSINAPEAGGTYHCVAINAPIPTATPTPTPTTPAE